MASIYLAFFIITSTSLANAASTHSGCSNFGAEVEITFENQVHLAQKFINSPSDETYREAITQQLHYVRGYFINKKTELPYSLTVSANNPEIEILKVSNSAYGQDLIIDPIHHPNIQVQNKYLKNSLKAGKVTSDQTAVDVTYRLTTSAYYCGAEEKLKDILTAIPNDPYLIYWSVKPQDRRSITWRKSTFTINPCADDEMADIPDPFYYWYFWNPNRIGLDNSKEKFDCQKLIIEGKDYQLTKLQTKVFESKKSINHKVHIQIPEEKIKTSIIFGVIDEAAEIIPWVPFLKKWRQLSPSKLHLETLLTEISSYEKKHSQVNIDRGSQYLSGFLKKIGFELKISKIIPKPKNNEIIFEGFLSQSSKAIQISLFFGHTDVLGAHKVEHWNFLKTALLNSDFILYNGHSGLGENLKISNLFTELNLKEKDFLSKIPKYQYFAYFSCYSYGYFGDDLVALREKLLPQSRTDIVLTASEFTSERGPLGFLRHLRLMTSLGEHNIDDSIWLYPNDQLIVKNFHSPKDLK